MFSQKKRIGVNSECSAGVNQLLVMLFISIPLFLFYFILLSFLYNIIDEIIKLVNHLFNNTLFSYIEHVLPIKLDSPINVIVLDQSFSVLVIDPNLTQAHIT